MVIGHKYLNPGAHTESPVYFVQVLINSFLKLHVYRTHPEYLVENETHG